jgi:hypothetical protein
MKLRHAQLPPSYFPDDFGLQWPIDRMPCYFSLEDMLGEMTPANDVGSPVCRERPLETEENLLKVVGEYRRLFGSTQLRKRLGGDIGRLIFGRRARSIG